MCSGSPADSGPGFGLRGLRAGPRKILVGSVDDVFHHFTAYGGEAEIEALVLEG